MTANVTLSFDTSRTTTALICAKAAWWRCRCSLIADCLKAWAGRFCTSPAWVTRRSIATPRRRLLSANKSSIRSRPGKSGSLQIPSQYRCRLPLRHPENTAKSCADKEARSQKVKKCKKCKKFRITSQTRRENITPTQFVCAAYGNLQVLSCLPSKRIRSPLSCLKTPGC